ncbi:hypothetical protein C8J57DRAFT_1655285 [Mycena rebaudengoi]|nr:hypothetical protein C8J57DRAFT_1655285 [Mycena rebaudengoi]
MSQSAIPPLDDTLGAIEIGGVVCTFLFGIGTLQTFYYYGHFSTDSKLLKSADSRAWTYHFDLAHNLLGDCDLLWPIAIHQKATALFVHDNFVFYVNIFHGPCITSHMKQISELQERYMSLVVTALSLGASVDVIIAVSISYCLWTMRTSGVNETRRMVDTLVLWTIESGVATGGTSVITTILVSLTQIHRASESYPALTWGQFVLRNDLIWVPFYLILAKCKTVEIRHLKYFPIPSLPPQIIDQFRLNGRQRFRVPKSDVVNLDTGHPSSNPSHLVFVPQSNMGISLEISTRRHSFADFGSSKDVEKGKH